MVLNMYRVMVRLELRFMHKMLMNFIRMERALTRLQRGCSIP